MRRDIQRFSTVYANSKSTPYAFQENQKRIDVTQIQQALC